MGPPPAKFWWQRYASTGCRSGLAAGVTASWFHRGVFKFAEATRHALRRCCCTHAGASVAWMISHRARAPISNANAAQQIANRKTKFDVRRELRAIGIEWDRSEIVKTSSSMLITHMGGGGVVLWFMRCDGVRVPYAPISMLLDVDVASHLDVGSHLEAKSQVSYFVVSDGEIAKRVGEVRMTKHLADRRDVAGVRIDVRGFGPPQ